VLKDIISVFIGLVGILLLSYGFYLIAPQYGFITMGLMLTAFSFLFSRAIAHNKLKNKKR
jgi:hypothetical protein